MSSGNNTSTSIPPTTTTSPPPAPTTSTSSRPPADPSSSTAPSTEPSSTPPTSLPSSSSETTTPSTSNPPSTTTTTTRDSSSSTTTSDSTTTTSNIPSSSTSIQTTVITTDGVTKTIQQTVTQTNPVNPTSSNPSGTSAGAGAGPTGGPDGGLQTPAKIGIAVVVPIVGVALLVVAGIYFWRKRKARKDLEEQRRKEVEDYTYNPNADPTLPAVGGAGAGGYEMKEDGSSGYRGWGSTTLAGSTGRKASTTMSGGGGIAYSDATSPTRAGVSDTRSGDPMINDGTHSPEGEILGAMGPSAANNRGADVHRGPSNASSSYSAAGRSDGSGDIGVAYGGDQAHGYNQYGQRSPYADQYGSPPQASELGGDGPVIRDNPARRNTRIESTGHYPQQSAGISQNF